MSDEISVSNGQAAGRDIKNKKRLSIDLQIDERGVLDQHVSIGTMFAGPVHIHVTVSRASDVALQDAEVKLPRVKKRRAHT